MLNFLNRKNCYKCIYQVQAQRYGVRREKRKSFDWGALLKKILKLILVIIISSVIIWGTWLFRHRSEQSIENVQVITTYEHIKPAILQKIINNYLMNDGFFNIDVIGLKQSLLELPWVDEVSIKRIWPDTIIVNIEEQRAIARWKNIALFNSKGMLFTPPLATFPANLPLLFGPEEDVQDVIVNYQSMQKLLAPLNFKITQLDIDERGSWHMIVNGSINIFLGSEDVFPRLQNFAIVYAKVIADHPEKQITAVDLRYKNGVAVHWDD